MVKKKVVKKSKKKALTKIDKELLELEDEYLEDLGGSEEPMPVKNLKMILANDNFVLFQDKEYTYKLDYGVKLKKLGI